MPSYGPRSTCPPPFTSNSFSLHFASSRYLRSSLQSQYDEMVDAHIS
jgi:hypothetical protein